MPNVRRRLLGAAVLAAGAMLASPAAHAFTTDDGAGGGAWSPKFDIEEQAKNFRKDGLDTSTTLKPGTVETPVGTLQFGVRSEPFNAFGSPLETNRAREHRRHYDRLFSPEYRFDSR